MAVFARLKSPRARTLLIIVLSVLVVTSIVTYIAVPDRVTAALTVQEGSAPGSDPGLMQPLVTTAEQAQADGSGVLYGSIDAEDGLDLTEITVSVVPTSSPGGAPAASFSLPHAGSYVAPVSLQEDDYTVTVAAVVDGKPLSRSAGLHVTPSGAYKVSLLVDASSPLFFFVPVPSY